MEKIIESLGIPSSPYVIAALTILVFVVLAKLTDLFVDKVLRKFSRFTKSDADDRIIDLLHRPILYTIVILGLVYTVRYLEFTGKGVFFLEGFLYSLMAIIWCVTLVKLSNTLIDVALYKVSDVTGLSKDVVPLTESISKIVIFVATLMVLFSLWNINITPLMASAGIAGAAIAFAAKDTIANLFGGIMVFMDKPYKIGDYIVLDQGERGEVVAIGMRSTRIKTRDDILISVPNSIIANTKIINESAPIPKFRIRIPVSVAYGSDIDLVQRVLLELAAANGNIFAEPEPRVRFRQFGESSLNFELLCWTKEPALRGRTIHELNCAIYNKFAELGIHIPFPQRDVHLFQS